MLKNYLKVAWRSLTKHKLFSFINIFGLASGMVVCMMAITKIKDGFDYDNFHPNIKSTYRITTNYTRQTGDPSLLLSSTPLPLGEYLKNNYQQIEKVTRIHFTSEAATSNNKNLYVHAAFTDVSFYEVFGFKLASGSPAISPHTAVMTEENAKLFFGDENPIGKSLKFGEYGDFTITGILEKPKSKSHLSFELLLPLTSLEENGNKKILADWTDESTAYTYIQLKDGIAQENFKTVLDEVSKVANTVLLPPNGETFQFGMQRLDKISPAMKPIFGVTAEPAITNLAGFALLGISMLILAFFNYVNLTLSRSLDRAREIGIRKVAGAKRSQVAMQFLIESIVVSAIAFMLAKVELGLLSAQPTIHRLISDIPQDFTLWAYFLGFTIFTGLVAGFIPAKILSGFQPTRVLAGKFNTKLFGAAGLRKSLMVAQFATSTVALVVLAVFFSQSLFMAKGDYGFERKQILNIPLRGQPYERLSTAFANVAGVESVSGISDLFGFSGGDIRYIKQQVSNDSIRAAYFAGSGHLLQTMQLKLVAGNNFTQSNDSNRIRKILINEEAAKQLKFENSEAVGQIITYNDNSTAQIEGVVKDFHFNSFLRSVEPLIICYEPKEFNYISVKISNGSEQNTLAMLRKAWMQSGTHLPFEYGWFDKELYNHHLHAEDLEFLGILTAMAMSIACLGLLGMVIYTVRTKSKELSIRRVLGASLGQVMLVASKEFIQLLFLAICIGLPLGFIVGQKFLQQYAYRINVGPLLLGLCALILLGLGAITIGWHVVKAARSNPVNSLRMD